jgi:hypothetical protein
MRMLGQDECLACQAIWAGCSTCNGSGRIICDGFLHGESVSCPDCTPQYAHVCLACPQCHERPVGVAIYVGAYCYRCGWREGDRVGHQGEW